MKDEITLFQTERIWANIRDEVWSLVDQYHSQGVAQNGEPALLLEDTLARRFNRKYCVITACCTDALIISLLALKLPHNSRIGVNNYTFTASAHAIARAGHIVYPIDVTSEYVLPKSLPRLDAIIAVELFGNMNDWSYLEGLGIPIINDAAQSLESHNGGHWSASKGMISCLSFSPSKTVSSWGSGGAVLTDDKDLADKCRLLRLHGKKTNNDLAIDPGLNSMMSSLEVAAVLTGLKYADSWQARRQKITRYLIDQSRYEHGMQDLSQHTYHKLVFRADERSKVLTKLADLGIATSLHYSTLIDDEELYKTGKSFTTSELLKLQSFTVPNQHTLTDTEVERIAEALK